MLNGCKTRDLNSMDEVNSHNTLQDNEPVNNQGN